MAGTELKIPIRDALEELGDKLPKFIAQMQVKRDDSYLPERFRKNPVSGKSEIELADILVDAFGENAATVTVWLLRAIGSNGPANELEEEVAKMRRAPRNGNSARASSASAPAGGAAAAAAPQKHFVDRHRKVLVLRVTNVSPILDHLLEKEVLKQEQYNRARKESTTEDQMRYLFDGPLLSGGDRSKDELQSALEENEPYLMEELKNSSCS